MSSGAGWHQELGAHPTMFHCCTHAFLLVARLKHVPNWAATRSIRMLSALSIAKMDPDAVVASMQASTRSISELGAHAPDCHWPPTSLLSTCLACPGCQICFVQGPCIVPKALEVCHCLPGCPCTVFGPGTDTCAIGELQWRPPHLRKGRIEVGVLELGLQPVAWHVGPLQMGGPMLFASWDCYTCFIPRPILWRSLVLVPVLRQSTLFLSQW